MYTLSEENQRIFQQLSDIECAFDNYLYLNDTQPILELLLNPEYREALSHRFPDLPLQTDNTGAISWTTEQLRDHRASLHNTINPVVFFCAERRFAHQFSSELEQSNLFVLLFALRGDFLYNINGQNYILREGECVINSTLLFYNPVRAGGSYAIGCIIHADFFHEILLKRLQGSNIFLNFYASSILQKSTSEGFLQIDTRCSDKLAFLFSNATLEYYRNHMYGSEVINSYVILAFSELLISYSGSFRTTNPSKSRTPDIRQILEYIQDNLATASATTIAEHFHYHPNYLNAFVKQATGKTITVLLLDTRLDRTRLLLTYGTEDINTIIRRVGYSNVSFFYQKFKERYGCTPSEYRARLRQ